MVLNAGADLQRITLKKTDGAFMLRAIGLKSSDLEPSQAPRDWALLVADSEDAEPVKVLEQVDTEFRTQWQTKIFMLPASNGPVKAKKLVLEIRANGGHADFSLGQLILYK
jgi:hypothetical protein